MATLKFSLMGASAREMLVLSQLLKEFESRHRVTVEPIVLNWLTAWDELQHFATYRDGPDVSVVGNSWITALRGMQVLRPFSVADISQVGGADAFLQSLWNTGCSGNQIWAVPWQVDTRAFFYWRPALFRAGVDEQTAFASCGDIERTIAALVESGQTALVGPTLRNARNLLINMAGWVWTRGGEFWDDAAKRVLLDQPATLQAIEEFVALHRSMGAANFGDLTDSAADQVFVDGGAAMIVSGPWVFREVVAQRPEMLEDLGVAAIPGVPVTGGSSLVIWQRSLEIADAANLIRFLTSSATQHRLAENSGQLPARLDTINDPDLNRNRFLRVLGQSALAGRCLPNDPLWGIVEDRIVRTLAALWEPALRAPSLDDADVLINPLTRLSHQLNTTLGHT